MKILQYTVNVFNDLAAKPDECCGGDEHARKVVVVVETTVFGQSLPSLPTIQ